MLWAEARIGGHDHEFRVRVTFFAPGAEDRQEIVATHGAVCGSLKAAQEQRDRAVLACRTLGIEVREFIPL